MDTPETSVEPTLRDLMNVLMKNEAANRAIEARLATLEVVQGKKVVNLEESDVQNVPESFINDDDYFDYLAKKKEVESREAVKEGKKVVVEHVTPVVGMDSVVQKVEQMQAAMRKSQGFEDYLIEIDDLCPFPNVKLPDGFKMPKLDLFDGTGNPHYHLRHYVGTMRPLGLTKEAIILLFPRSLKGAALKWYLSLGEASMASWSIMANDFLNQYNFNKETEITIQDLDMMKQLTNEPFIDFVARWRGKVALMSTRPTEKEQLRLITKNLEPCYYDNMFANTATSFDQFIDLGRKVQEALQSGRISKAVGKHKNAGEGTSGNSGGRDLPRRHATEIATVQSYGASRNFTPLSVSYARMLEKLTKAKLLSPLIPKSPPNPLPLWWATSDYCEFHQSKGHSIENCMRLKHEIENLFDQGKIPRPTGRPNVNQNRLPRYHAVTPPNVNASENGGSLFDT